MQIDLDQAIDIYARAMRARHRGRARLVALEQSEHLRSVGDHEGSHVWKRMAERLPPPPPRASGEH